MMAAAEIVRDRAGLRRSVGAARARGLTVGFAPTMGALHAGHAALIGRSAEENDLTVVSIFVNPAQFDDPADLAGYPRREEADIELATAAGADICFLPDVREIYPEGHATKVTVRGEVSSGLEAQERGPQHFEGVCTVLSILFSLVAPDTAYFGEKDAQQLAVVRRLVCDLGLSLSITGVPTVRDPDGLALASRNSRLAPDERDSALSLSRALSVVGQGICQGEVRTAREARDVGLAMLARGGAEASYFEAVDPKSFQQDPYPTPATLLVCAARVGEVRLIDNMTAHFAAETGYGFDREREES